MRRKRDYRELTELDLKIVASIKDDARRPVEEIADMVGASPKTVKRRLEDMISEGSLELHTRTDSYLCGDTCLIGHVVLRTGSDKVGVAKRLLSKHKFQEAYFRTYANLPGLIMLVFWSDKVAEIRQVIREISEDEDVTSVMMNFTYLQRMYATWRDRLPEVNTSRSAKA